MQESSKQAPDLLVRWIREASPYIHAHRGRVFVVYVGGDVVADPRFSHFVQDLALLCAVGIRLVVVHGARPQIEQRLLEHDVESRYVGRFRLTDERALEHVVAAIGTTRVAIESKFSLTAMNRRATGNRLRVAGGNFVVGKPAGIVDGVDLRFTGVVRRVDVEAIGARLAVGDLVLLSPLGYSPTGEVFNLSGLDLATEAACELGASKLLVMIDRDGLQDGTGQLLRQLTVREARELGPGHQSSRLTERALECAGRACVRGVDRVHLINQDVDGALLRELFTRDGIGTLLSSTAFEQMRRATIDDVAGILDLIRPFEEDGVLVKRSREKLEMEIDQFTVLLREATVIACGAMYSFTDCGAGEIACIAVHPDYHNRGFGDILLEALEKGARQGGVDTLFVLTTQAVHWFQERGYVRAELAQLPVEKQSLYNYQRNSAVLIKSLA